MVKKNLVLLIIGIVLIGSGFAVLANYTSIMQERHPNLEVFFEGELQQAQLSSTPINLLQEEDVTVTILSPSNQMFFSLTGPDDSTLEETVFFGSLSHHLEAKSNGTHIINFGNMDTHSIDVIAILSEQPINDEEFVLSMASSFLAGSFLIFAGMLIVFASIVILVVKKIRSENNSTKLKDDHNKTK